MTTIHAYTGDQMILDGPQQQGRPAPCPRWRQSTSSRTPPALQRRSAWLFRNSTASSSAPRSVFRFPPAPPPSWLLLSRARTSPRSGINAAMKAAASESFGYNEDQIVSSDIIGMTLWLSVRRYPDHGLPRSTTTPIRFRSFPGTTTRTPTPARWSAPLSTSLN